jgi:hypothetical protein
MRWVKYGLRMTFCLLVLALAQAIALGQQDPRKQQSGRVGFAFANASGTALLTVSALTDDAVLVENASARPDMALCGNQLLPIAFAGYQKQGPKDDGRHWSRNFDQREGYRFRVLRGHAEDDESCLIAKRDFFAGKEVLAVTRQLRDKPCDPQAMAALARFAGRGLRSCKEIGRLSTGESVLLAEFQRRGNELLAAIALNRANRLVVHALPAKFDPETNAGWRVEDGGSLGNSQFMPLFALRQMPAETVELGIEWSGAEGVSLLLLRSSGAHLTEVTKGFRYLAPL